MKSAGALRSSNETLHNPYRVVWGPQRFYLSIGWKTLIAFALVVFIPMLGLMMITGQTLRDAMEAETIRSLQANLRGAWRVYHERTDSIRAALIQSAASPSVRRDMQERDGKELAALLERHAALLSTTDIWLVLDPQQQVMARRNGEIGKRVTLNNLVSRAFTFMEPITSTELLPNELFMEENPLKYSNLNTKVMAQVVVVPVHEENRLLGALAGIILLNDDDWLPNAIHDYLSIDAALFGSVIQESRIIAASTRPNNIWATGLLAPSSLNERVNKGDVFKGKVEINEIPCFVISEPIFNMEGKPVGALSIGEKSSNIEAIIHDNATNIYMFIGVGIVLSLIIAYLAYRDTMTPMHAIRRAMDSFAAGRLGVRTDIQTKDEFEELGQGFNRMAVAIQDHQERVESFNSLSSLLISSLKPRELMQNVLDKVIELTRAQAGVIYLKEQQGGDESLVPYVAYALNMEAMGPLRFGQGLAGESALKRRATLVKDIPEDCRIHIELGITSLMPKEIAFLPIVYRNTVMGVMVLATLNSFRKNELSLLESMTNQIAIVLENALSHEQVERLSITDVLTGTFNRRYFSERLEEEFAKSIRYHSPLSFLIIDVDHFKKVNDTYGHQVGDQALVTVASIMQQNLRATDMLGRYGGEEFVVLLPHASLQDALTTAEKLRAQVNATPIPAMGNKSVSISIGVATFPDHNIASADELVRRADEALYAAKEGGRNQVVQA